MKCCVSSTVDGDDMLWNGDVRIECWEDVGTDCEFEYSDTDW